MSNFNKKVIRKDQYRNVLREGEGTRPNGTYEYRWTENGKRKRFYARTLDELREKENNLEYCRRNGLKMPKERLTVNDMYKIWKSIKVGLNDNTKQNYMYLYERYVMPEFGTFEIFTLKKSDVCSFYVYLKNTVGLKINTIDGIHTVLHQVLEVAVDDEYIVRNPSDCALKKLQMTTGGKKKRNALTLEQTTVFLNYIKKTPTFMHWYPVFAVMIGSGLRVGELTGLRWCDINLEEGYIDVSHALVYYCNREAYSQHASYYAINVPKTPAGIRRIEMIDFVKEAFEIQKSYLEEKKLICKSVVDNYTDFIFLNRFGTVLHQGTLNRAIKRIVNNYNQDILCSEICENSKVVLLPDFSTHILRHTFATRICESGINPKVIQKVMGHADFSTTMDIYTDVSSQFSKKAMEKFNEYMNENLESEK